jgi:hypothetical protein
MVMRKERANRDGKRVLVRTERVQQVRDLARVEMREGGLDHLFVSIEVLQRGETTHQELMARMLRMPWWRSKN